MAAAIPNEKSRMRVIGALYSQRCAESGSVPGNAPRPDLTKKWASPNCNITTIEDKITSLFFDSVIFSILSAGMISGNVR